MGDKQLLRNVWNSCQEGERREWQNRDRQKDRDTNRKTKVWAKTLDEIQKGNKTREREDNCFVNICNEKREEREGRREKEREGEREREKEREREFVSRKRAEKDKKFLKGSLIKIIVKREEIHNCKHQRER